MTQPVTQTQWAETMTARQGHLLQSWAWGELKGRFGWDVRRLHADGGVAQLLLRRLPLGLTIAYIPKGPAVAWSNSAQTGALFELIQAEARRHKAIFLKVEPDVWSTDSQADTVVKFLRQIGFNPAGTIQPRATQIVDLEADETAILAAMKQKCRYNIRLAHKKGVVVREGDAADLATFYELSQLTAARDGFGIHPLSYYQRAYDLFAPDHCALLIAEYNGNALAALMLFRQGRDAYYFFGASSNQHRNLMPTYLLQWAAIKWAKARGCARYDLWGLPDADPARLEAEFQQRHDGLWGVYRFKRGFGGEIRRSVGAFDYVYQPFLYRLYKLYRKLV